VQLATEIGQRLDVARVGPQGPADPLTLRRAAAAIENEKGDELLLSCTGRPDGRASVGDEAEAPEQLDAERGRVH
jgi:hypothetical protein